MAEETDAAEYTIAAVSKLTGVSCHALRVWERRYGFPSPNRSASGHRRYGIDQVRAIRALGELNRGGRPIGELVAELREGRLGAESEPEAEATPAGPLAERDEVAELVDRLGAGDLAGGDAHLDRLAGGMGAEELIERVIGPCLVEAGDRWFRREFQIYQERCATHVLRGRLLRMIDEARRGNRHPEHTAVIGMVQGDRHSGGVLILNVFLERAGWRVHNLGADVPVREFQKAVEALRPDAVGLSFVLSRNINRRFRELAQIAGPPLLVGGRSILNYQGLARRHGLIPLAGPISLALPRWMAEYRAWVRAREGKG